MSDHPLPLAGIRVVDAATLFAGPIIGTMLGDYGADVIKVEHPRGDTLRSLGWEKDGVSLWWATVGRNKRSVALSLSDPEGADAMRRLLRTADVFVENFRTGTLERWGLGWEELHELNPSLIMIRTTGFGQTGPYAQRAGFGTLAESMSGFAHMNGYPDGPPTLPPFALGDGVAALTGAFATMLALWWRDTGGTGQMVDLSIFEPLFWILGPQASVYDQTGDVQGRTGNRAPFTSPRNAYQSSDGVWLGVSASAQSIAERVMTLVGRSDLLEEPWFGSHAGRLEHQDELDVAISRWIGSRTAAEVVRRFEDVHAAISPIMSIADIFQDPQYEAREAIVEVAHPKLGSLRMQGVIPRMGETPGSVRWAGQELGESTYEVLAELGLDAVVVEKMQARGVAYGPSGRRGAAD